MLNGRREITSRVVMGEIERIDQIDPPQTVIVLILLVVTARLTVHLQ